MRHDGGIDLSKVLFDLEVTGLSEGNISNIFESVPLLKSRDLYSHAELNWCGRDQGMGDPLAHALLIVTGSIEYARTYLL
jgi:hypothetical protein